MPPSIVHFNGSVNLPDAETVMREIVTRVPSGVRRIPDGEPGDRQQWIFFQLDKFFGAQGLEGTAMEDVPAEGYGELSKVRLAEGTDPDSVGWPDLGYANEYTASYAIFRRLRDDGVVPAGIRFQVEYPTPVAGVGSWVATEHQPRLVPSYERALFADLSRLLETVPHEDIAVQWDVAVEFAILEGSFPGADAFSFDAVIERLASCVDVVPADVPVGLHLCYGDYMHRHFQEPTSLELQVRVVNAVTAAAGRPVSFFSFTVPQYQREPAYFAPLGDLSVPAETELYFALVPYHQDKQPQGTTADQVRLVDEHLGARPWGVCTECGMGRVDRDETTRILDLHSELLTTG